MTDRPVDPSGQFHAVRFYKDADELCSIVARFVGEGFAEKQAAILIATPVHLAGIVHELKARSFDVDRLQQRRDLVLLDAEQVLAQFMVDGMPSSAQFVEALMPVLAGVEEDRPNCTIRAYGEMVDVLWKAGRTVAATRLEMLWNELAATHAFSLLCGYAMGNFYKDAAVDEICRHHSHVVSPVGDLAIIN